LSKESISLDDKEGLPGVGINESIEIGHYLEPFHEKDFTTPVKV
jgi:hypothetical protein